VLGRTLTSGARLAQLASTMKNAFVVSAPGAVGTLHERPQNLGMEAYDEKANGNVVAHSMSYNAEASRQDDFGEMHYPTVTSTQESLGFTMSIQLHLLQEEVRRQVNGDVNDFGRQNIIKAYVEPDLLRNDQTEIVPVFRDDGSENDSSHHFAPAADVATVMRKVDRHDVPTAPLKFGTKFDLLGISQTKALLDAGVMDQTDAIDPALRLTNIYVKLGAAAGSNVLRFSVKNLPTHEFNSAAQGNGRQMTLNFATESLRVTSATTKLDGSAISQFVATIGTHTVRLAASAFGNMLLDRGETLLNAGPVTVASVTDETGTQVSMTSGVGKQIADLFVGSQALFFDMLAYRTNSNRLNRGQLIDDQIYHQLYAVPTLPPITALRPVGESEANDGERIQALIVTTKIRASNLAVDAHLAYLATLKEIYNEKDSSLKQPDTLGITRFLVDVVYEEGEIDVAKIINSLESTDHAENVRAVIINRLRDMTARLYLKSALQVARQMHLGTGAGKPLVILGTDPYIASYLNLTGDTRLLGDQFDFKVVTTMNRRMRNKLTVAFGETSALSSGVPSMMHWGNMIWRPEITATMPITRNGRISQEVTVTPSLRHINHLPIGGLLEIKNIRRAMETSLDVKVATTPQ
jgi:hypothetical protein